MLSNSPSISGHVATQLCRQTHGLVLPTSCPFLHQGQDLAFGDGGEYLPILLVTPLSAGQPEMLGEILFTMRGEDTFPGRKPSFEQNSLKEGFCSCIECRIREGGNCLQCPLVILLCLGDARQPQVSREILCTPRFWRLTPTNHILATHTYQPHSGDSHLPTTFKSLTH